GVAAELGRGGRRRDQDERVEHEGEEGRRAEYEEPAEDVADPLRPALSRVAHDGEVTAERRGDPASEGRGSGGHATGAKEVSPRQKCSPSTTRSPPGSSHRQIIGHAAGAVRRRSHAARPIWKPHVSPFAAHASGIFSGGSATRSNPAFSSTRAEAGFRARTCA